MTELSSKARALVATGRAGYRPSTADRERVAGALRAHLGSTALPPDSPPKLESPPHSPAAALGAKAVLGVVVGLGLVGGALFLGFRPQVAANQPPLPNPTTASASGSKVSASNPNADSANALPTAPAGGELPVSSALPAASAARTDRLAQEVALLSRATSALRAGRSADALALLSEHQRKFPKGALSEERSAAKAQALCSLGRRSEGRAELARLAPRSPAALRAQQVCDDGKP